MILIKVYSLYWSKSKNKPLKIIANITHNIGNKKGIY